MTSRHAHLRKPQQALSFLLLLFLFLPGCHDSNTSKKWFSTNKKKVKKWFSKKSKNVKQNKMLQESILQGDTKKLKQLLKRIDPNAPLSLASPLKQFIRLLRESKAPTRLLKSFLKYRQLVRVLQYRLSCGKGVQKIERKLKGLWNELKKKPSLLLDRKTYSFPKGPTPLHLSALFCRTDIMHLLLKRKANVHASDFQGLTPLHYASCHAVAKILLKHKANPNAPSKDSLTPLHLALTRNIAKELLHHRAKVNARDLCGNTPLHTSITLGYSTAPPRPPSRTTAKRPSFSRIHYLESHLTLTSLATNATQWFNNQHKDRFGNPMPRHFPGIQPNNAPFQPGTAFYPNSPPPPCKNNQPTLYPHNKEQTNSPPWTHLKFQLSSYHYFQYKYTSAGTDDKAHFTIQARAHIDCDGKLTIYQISGHIDTNTGKVTLSTIQRTKEKNPSQKNHPTSQTSLAKKPTSRPASSPELYWLFKKLVLLSAKIESALNKLDEVLDISTLLLKHGADAKALNNSGKDFYTLYEERKHIDWND